MTKSTVAVLYTTPNTVIDDYRKLFVMAGGEKALDRRSTTILKDNISWHYPMPGANTTPWQIEGAARALQFYGYEDLVCVQNETVVVSAEKGEDLNCYQSVFARQHIGVKYNYAPDMKWSEYRPTSKMLALYKVFPDGIFIPDYFIGKNIVHLPTVKTHIYTTTTGAMKNAFGGLLNKNRHYAHTWIHQVLVDLLTIQYEIHSGMFAMMDGTTAGNGQGPRTLTPVVKNVILASADQVAIDAVAARMMGFWPLDIAYIRMADEMGLGNGDPRNIRIVGEDVENVNWHFEVGGNVHSMLAWLAWYGPTRIFQNLVMHTPLVAIPTFISTFNHDYIQWPLKCRRQYEDWLDHTDWGHLFKVYQGIQKRMSEVKRG